MTDETLTPPSADRSRHRVLLVVIAAGLLATVIGWRVQGVRAPLSPALFTVQVVTTAVLSALFIAAWLKLLPQRVLEWCCLLYIAGVCIVCMALRMYSPTYGSGIHIDSLYLWIPLVYVFAFMLASHRTGLFLSLGIFALFVAVSVPYLIHDIGGSYANLTVQLHLASAIMITTLYFFSSYQHRLRLAQVEVDQLVHLSSTDELTRLFNRRHMAAAIDAELAQSANGGHGFAVMLFDVDHFKAVNDRCGHGVGDQLLVALARCATEEFRGSGVVGRWGGDEFLVLIRDVAPVEAVRRADALCVRVASSVLPGRSVTISCGLAFAEPEDNIDSLLQRADAALYASKRGGRNRVECALDPGAALELESGSVAR